MTRTALIVGAGIGGLSAGIVLRQAGWTVRIFERAALARELGIYWFLSLARELVPPGMRNPAAILAHMAPRFDATFRAVTSSTDDLRCDDLVDRDPIPFWARAR